MARTGVEFRRKKLHKRLWSKRFLILIFLPAAAYYIIFHYIPMYGIVIAFKDYNMFKGVMGSAWVGIENFQKIFASTDFWNALRNTLMLKFLSLLAGFPAPIIIALLLNELRSVKFKRVTQAILYLPHFISWVIAATLIITMLSVNSYGIVNKVIKAFGGEAVNFMGNPSSWVAVFVFSGIWKTAGWDAIIYLAALTGIDPMLYEAAVLDGANRWQQTKFITLPGIKPTIAVLLILSIGRLLGVGFDQAYNLGGSVNPGVLEVSDVLSTYIYRIGIVSRDTSKAAAVGLFNSVVSFVLLISANIFSKKYAEHSIF